MIKINSELRPEDLRKKIERVWEASAPKIWSLDRDDVPGAVTPVFTVKGKYTARGWTEWTQGFVYGSALLQFDATGEEEFLRLGRDRDRSTHGSSPDAFWSARSRFQQRQHLWEPLEADARGRIAENAREADFYELALKCSGAVQAARWTHIANGEGFIHSFNGPHSLFADTIRSLRALALSHQLGHLLMGERDEKISLLRRLVEHLRSTAKWTVFYGTGRDIFDVRGRVAHESVFNVNDGSYRCPGTQQGFSPFTTWTRSLAWIMCGYAEQLEWIATRPDQELERIGGRDAIEAVMLNAAKATCDFYIAETPSDGVPYWDTGAPGLVRLGDYRERPAEPFNEYEPVDSSAAAIAAQGLLRLAHFLADREQEASQRYWRAGLTVADTLFAEPYLSVDSNHQGLLLHSIYHRPNGWDYTPPGRKIPCGEASMWGDYHLRELALYVQRVLEEKPYLAFFGEEGKSAMQP